MNKIFKYEVKSGDFENGGKISDDIMKRQCKKDTQPPMRIFVQWASAKVWDLLI